MAQIKKGTNKFYIGEDEQSPIAQITYRPVNDTKLLVDHTYVSDELRGQGIAGQLLEKMIAFARAEEKRIIPECSYVKVKMERNKEYHDLIAD